MSAQQIESFNRATSSAEVTQEPTTTGFHVDPDVRQFFPEAAKAAGKGAVKGVQAIASLPGLALEHFPVTPPRSTTAPLSEPYPQTTYPLAGAGGVLKRAARIPELLMTDVKGF